MQKTKIMHKNLPTHFTNVCQ